MNQDTYRVTLGNDKALNREEGHEDEPLEKQVPAVAESEHEARRQAEESRDDKWTALWARCETDD